MKLKNKKFIIIGASVVLVLTLVLTTILMYNNLVSLKEKTITRYEEIESHLQKRIEIIPELVEMSKGHTNHKPATINTIYVTLENLKMANGIIEVAAANRELTTVIKPYLDTIENFPKLKENKEFLNLKIELSEVEKKIASARIKYNDAVYNYNKKIKKFPNNILANILDYQEEPAFESDDV